MTLKYIGAISDWLVQEWGRVYTPLNVAGELLKMEQWLEANPRRRKKNYQRFVVNWLNKAHASVASAQVNARLCARAGQYNPNQHSPDYSKECEQIKRRYPDLA